MVATGGDGGGVIGAVDNGQAVFDPKGVGLQAGHHVVLVISAGADEEIRLPHLLLLELGDDGGVAVDDGGVDQAVRHAGTERGIALKYADGAIDALQHLGERETVFISAEDHHAELVGALALPLQTLGEATELPWLSKDSDKISFLDH